MQKILVNLFSISIIAKLITISKTGRCSRRPYRLMDLDDYDDDAYDDDDNG